MSNNFDILEALWLRREKKRRAQKTIEGALPLTYTAKNAGTLKNYRIYGNTVGGESVGDRTENLFDLNAWANTIRSISGDGLISISGSTVSITSVNDTDCYTEPYANNQTGVYKIPVKPNTIYTVNWYGSNYRIMIFENGSFNYMYNFFSDKSQSFTTHSDTTFLTLRFGIMPSNPVGTTATISEFIISEGSTPLPYEPYGYKVPVTVSNGADTLTTPIYLPEQIKKVGDEAEYIDYGEQKVHRVRKNLLPNTATSQTINGVTFTVNGDGSVTCDRTASKAIYFSFATNLESGTYIISGTPRGMTENNAVIFINANYSTIGLSNNVIDNDGNGKQFVATQSGTAALTITIKSGYTCNNLTFYPMIRKADIEDDTYEPYIENTEVDVTLPALPTIAGTNTLSVGTEVQPSKVIVKGKISQE